jgi:hypothetical protein
MNKTFKQPKKKLKRLPKLKNLKNSAQDSNKLKTAKKVISMLQTELKC